MSSIPSMGHPRSIGARRARLPAARRAGALTIPRLALLALVSDFGRALRAFPQFGLLLWLSAFLLLLTGAMVFLRVPPHWVLIVLSAVVLLVLLARLAGDRGDSRRFMWLARIPDVPHFLIFVMGLQLLYVALYRIEWLESCVLAIGSALVASWTFAMDHSELVTFVLLAAILFILVFRPDWRSGRLFQLLGALAAVAMVIPRMVRPDSTDADEPETPAP